MFRSLSRLVRRPLSTLSSFSRVASSWRRQPHSHLASISPVHVLRPTPHLILHGGVRRVISRPFHSDVRRRAEACCVLPARLIRHQKRRVIEVTSLTTLLLGSITAVNGIAAAVNLYKSYQASYKGKIRVAKKTLNRSQGVSDHVGVNMHKEDRPIVTFSSGSAKFPPGTKPVPLGISAPYIMRNQPSVEKLFDQDRCRFVYLHGNAKIGKTTFITNILSGRRRVVYLSFKSGNSTELIIARALGLETQAAAKDLSVDELLLILDAALTEIKAEDSDDYHEGMRYEKLDPDKLVSSEELEDYDEESTSSVVIREHSVDDEFFETAPLFSRTDWRDRPVPLIVVEDLLSSRGQEDIRTISKRCLSLFNRRKASIIFVSSNRYTYNVLTDNTVLGGMKERLRLHTMPPISIDNIYKAFRGRFGLSDDDLQYLLSQTGSSFSDIMSILDFYANHTNGDIEEAARRHVESLVDGFLRLFRKIPQEEVFIKFSILDRMSRDSVMLRSYDLCWNDQEMYVLFDAVLEEFGKENLLSRSVHNPKFITWVRPILRFGYLHVLTLPEMKEKREDYEDWKRKRALVKETASGTRISQDRPSSSSEDDDKEGLDGQ